MRTVEHPLVAAVSRFIGNDGVLYSFHNPKEDGIVQPDGIVLPRTRSLDYFRQLGVDRSLLYQIFNRRGELIYRVEQSFDINAYPPEATAAFIASSIETPMHLINPAIAGHNRQAKNNHDLRHAKRVWQIGDAVMQTVGTPMYERRAGAVALLMHDIGNLLGRDHHPPLSVLLRREFFPNLIMTEGQEEIIDEAILIHDGDLLYTMMDQWKAGSVEEATEFLRLYGDVALSLIIGDKIDIGLDRLPSKEFPIDWEDPHRIVNLYADLNALAFTEDMQKVGIHIDFGRELNPEQMVHYSHLLERTKDGELKRMLPEIVVRNIEANGTDEYAESKRFFWEIYYPRMMLTILSSFAINPLLEEVVIVFDNHMEEGGYTGRELYHFNKDPQDRFYIATTMLRIFESLSDEAKAYPSYRLFADLARKSRELYRKG